MARKDCVYECTTKIDDYGEEWFEFNTTNVSFNECDWRFTLLGYPGGIRNGCFILKQAKLFIMYIEDIPALNYYKDYIVDKRKKPTINIALNDIKVITLHQGDRNVQDDSICKYKIPSKYVIRDDIDWVIKPEHTIYITAN